MRSLTFVALVAVAVAAGTAFAQNCTNDSQCAPNGCCVGSADSCTMTPPNCAAVACAAIACTSKAPLCQGYGCGCDRGTGHCIVKAIPVEGGSTAAPLMTPAPVPRKCYRDSDCHPTTCCHANQCSAEPGFGPCNMMCTDICEAGTMDCGQGSCGCDVSTGQCIVAWNTDPVPPVIQTSPVSPASPQTSSSDVSVPLWAVVTLAAVAGASIAVALGCTIHYCTSTRNTTAVPSSPVKPTSPLSNSTPTVVVMASGAPPTHFPTGLPGEPIKEAYACTQPE